MLSHKARRGLRSGLVLSILLLAPAATPAAAQEPFHPSLDPGTFPVPAALAPNVEFWREVFARYDSTQTLIHDDQHLDVVFAVVDVSDLVRAGASAVAVERAQRDRVRAATQQYQQVLRRLAGDRNATASDADMARVRALYAASAAGASDFGAAAGRVRAQTGLRDRFREAIQVSGMFMPGIERILGEHGVPTLVKALPFVESMYNYRARSSVGASGVWQFMPGTARQYMQMDTAVDARSDVWLAAEGAARMLADNYRRVQSWPLAITGYNHGIAGMERAVRQVGSSSIDDVVARYQSRTFGFASRNFYAEFVAAATVFEDRAVHFPGIEPLPAVEFEVFTPGRFVSLLDLAGLTATEVSTLVDLNPALHGDVGRGTLLVPATYPLRVPLGARPAFEDAFARLPEARKPARQITATYRVARGDTLGTIAARFGTSTAALQRANNLPRADRIYVNQVLDIPNGGGSWSPLVWSPDAAPVRAAGTAPVGPDITGGAGGTHVVQRGETLGAIASRYGTSVSALMAANDITSANRIQVGARLTVPGDGSVAPQRHVVRRGETLTAIAARYGHSVDTLVAANDLRSPDRLRVGMALSIPAGN
jgi:membrane-bound lytic murein transglycosylase D